MDSSYLAWGVSGRLSLKAQVHSDRELILVRIAGKHQCPGVGNEEAGVGLKNQ